MPKYEVANAGSAPQPSNAISQQPVGYARPRQRDLAFRPKEKRQTFVDPQTAAQVANAAPTPNPSTVKQSAFAIARRFLNAAPGTEEYAVTREA